MAESGKSVSSLYAILFRSFNNIPDPCTVEWMEFGFCYCADVQQQEALAAAYLRLAESGTPLEQIAHAWETTSLRHLMDKRGVDIPLLESAGIFLQRPSIDEIGIYRLMAEVKHGLSGSYCPCFRSACRYHSQYETLLSKESEGDYGFHGANAWERWQLLNFYSHVFKSPGFDARKMQESRRNADPGALDEYLNSIVPNFQRKIGNEFLADAMFPKLRDRIEFPHGRAPCYCIVHNTITSEGIDFRTNWRVSWLRSFLEDGDCEQAGFEAERA